jgi:hypothetical protein
VTCSSLGSASAASLPFVLWERLSAVLCLRYDPRSSSFTTRSRPSVVSARCKVVACVATREASSGSRLSTNMANIARLATSVCMPDSTSRRFPARRSSIMRPPVAVTSVQLAPV